MSAHVFDGLASVHPKSIDDKARSCSHHPTSSDILPTSSASWPLVTGLLVLRKMTSPFRNPQNDNTAIIAIGGGTPDTEKESSSTKFEAHENQPTLNSNTTPARMFLRRRIVLLTLALILAIVIITVTIVGLLVSSYNDRQQAEAEARNSQITHTEIENYEEMKNKMSSITSGLPESDDTDVDERDTVFLLVPPATANTDSSGSGSEPTEKTSVNGNSILLHESSEEVGSGDSVDKDQYQAGSGDFSGDRRDVGSGFQHNQSI